MRDRFWIGGCHIARNWYRRKITEREKYLDDLHDTILRPLSALIGAQREEAR